MKKLVKLGTACALSMTSFMLASGSPAKAAACVDSLLGSLVTPCDDAAGFTFQLIGSTGFNTSTTNGVGDVFSFQSSSPLGFFQYSLQGASGFTNGGSPYTLTYSVTAPAGKNLTQFTSGMQTADNLAAGSWTIVGTQGTATTTLTTPQQISGGLYTFSPRVTTQTFTATLNVNSGNVSAVASQVQAATIPTTTSAPGPLPLLGAGMAFGFSRKVRSRIKVAA